MTTAVPSRARVPRRRVAIGPKRPQYLASREIDRVLMVVTALMSEVSALRDRLATHEALADLGIVATGAAVEAYRPDTAAAASREAERTAMMKRVYRVVFEELDAVQQTELEATQWSMPDEWNKT